MLTVGVISMTSCEAASACWCSASSWAVTARGRAKASTPTSTARGWTSGGIASTRSRRRPSLESCRACSRWPIQLDSSSCASSTVCSSISASVGVEASSTRSMASSVWSSRSACSRARTSSGVSSALVWSSQRLSAWRASVPHPSASSQLARIVQLKVASRLESSSRANRGPEWPVTLGSR